MQSSWASGFGAAAIVSGLIPPVWGWRAVLPVGVLPAFFTLWIRRRVEEPAIWQRTPKAWRASSAELFRGDFARATTSLTLMNACTLGGHELTLTPTVARES